MVLGRAAMAVVLTSALFAGGLSLSLGPSACGGQLASDERDAAANVAASDAGVAMDPPAACGTPHLDPTFGTNGVVIVDNLTPVAAAYDQEGRLIVAGGGASGFTLYRFRSDGSPDPTFGTNGRSASPIEDGGASTASAIAVTPEGSIIAAGYLVDPTSQGGVFRDGALRRERLHRPFFAAAVFEDGKTDQPIVGTVGVGFIRFSSAGEIELEGMAPTTDTHTFPVAAWLQPDGRVLVPQFSDDGIELLRFASDVGSARRRRRCSCV